MHMKRSYTFIYNLINSRYAREKSFNGKILFSKKGWIRSTPSPAKIRESEVTRCKHNVCVPDQIKITCCIALLNRNSL